MAFIGIFICIALLVLLISWCKLNAFLAFLVVSILAGFVLGLPADKVIGAVQHGIGDTLGSLIVVISLGAMLGKLVAESGAARQIASALMNIFGPRYIQWALMITGFIIGIPLFYNVGFVLIIPLIFSIVYQYKLPAIYTGLPMLAALSVTHGFLPPHPSPAALVAQLHANMGLTLIYGLIVATPAIIIAGPVFARAIRSVPSSPLETFRPAAIPDTELPGTANSFITALLPVLLLIITTVLSYMLKNSSPQVVATMAFVGDPSLVMLVSVLIATFSLGISKGRKMQQVMNLYVDSVKDVGIILLIIAGAGALKQVLTDSGVSDQLGAVLKTWNVDPLILGWLIAALIRVCVGSATVAGLTTAGIIAPLMQQSAVNPNLMVLSIGAGSLMFSHVNDSGFWLFKEYFNLSIRNTLRTWSIMETIVAFVGLAGVMVLHIWI